MSVLCYWCRRDEHVKCGQRRPTRTSPTESCRCLHVPLQTGHMSADDPTPSEASRMSADERLAAMLAEAITCADVLALENLHAEWARETVGRELAAVLRDAGWVQRDEILGAREAVAVALTEQLSLYTLPANYARPLGSQTHHDIARRCGPLNADAALAAVIEHLGRLAADLALHAGPLTRGILNRGYYTGRDWTAEYLRTRVAATLIDAGWVQRDEVTTCEVTGKSLIAAERQRQVESEGYDEAHDREHGPAGLVSAANSYVFGTLPGYALLWPWSEESWKPRDRLSNLIRGGALYRAALDAGGDQSSTSAHLADVGTEIDAILSTARTVLVDAQAAKRRSATAASAVAEHLGGGDLTSPRPVNPEDWCGCDAYPAVHPYKVDRKVYDGAPCPSRRVDPLAGPTEREA